MFLGSNSSAETWVRDQEVGGSNPLAPTKILFKINCLQAAFWGAGDVENAPCPLLALFVHRSYAASTPLMVGQVPPLTVEVAVPTCCPSCVRSLSISLEFPSKPSCMVPHWRHAAKPSLPPSSPVMRREVVLPQCLRPCAGPHAVLCVTPRPEKCSWTYPRVSPQWRRLGGSARARLQSFRLGGNLQDSQKIAVEGLTRLAEPL
jgi:hypothetical protein